MPNCFTLTPKADPEDGPMRLIDIDVLLCEHFGEPIDDIRFLNCWVDIIGLYLAFGKTFDEIRQLVHSPRLVNITNYLDAHFTSDAWYEHK